MRTFVRSLGSLASRVSYGVTAIVLGAACEVRPEFPDAKAIEFPEIDATDLIRRYEPALPVPGALDTAGPPRAVDEDRELPAAARLGPLELETVLESVRERYPPLLSVLVERDLASGRVQRALGAFDTGLSAGVKRNFTGYYEATYGNAMVEQPLASGGELYGGYRITRGGLPDYYTSRTQLGGEVALGGRLPLFRDRDIDLRRLQLRQEEIDEALADPKIGQARIDFVYAATLAYYDWVAAGARLRIARELLGLAKARVDSIAQGVEREFFAAIDITDNERQVGLRRIFVVRAERELEKSALRLSLFLRDETDAPLVPREEDLPERFEAFVPPDLARFAEDAELALRIRPEVRRILLEVEKVRVEQGFAENRGLPEIDVIFDASKNIDQRPYFDRNEFELFLGLEFQLPLERREAKGRLAIARAQLQRLKLDGQYLRESILNQITDALSAWQASFDQLEQAEENVRLARELVEAERRSFELRRGDLLRINLRESQLADAELLQVEAILGYFRAAATYQAALGVDARPGT